MHGSAPFFDIENNIYTKLYMYSDLNLQNTVIYSNCYCESKIVTVISKIVSVIQKIVTVIKNLLYTPIVSYFTVDISSLFEKYGYQSDLGMFLDENGH